MPGRSAAAEVVNGNPEQKGGQQAESEEFFLPGHGGKGSGQGEDVCGQSGQSS